MLVYLRILAVVDVAGVELEVERNRDARRNKYLSIEASAASISSWTGPDTGHSSPHSRRLWQALVAAFLSANLFRLDLASPPSVTPARAVLRRNPTPTKFTIHSIHHQHRASSRTLELVCIGSRCFVEPQ